MVSSFKQSKDGPLQKPTRKSYHFLTSPTRKWVEDKTMENPGKARDKVKRQPISCPPARWVVPEGLALKKLGFFVYQSDFNGFWYFKGPTYEEYKGPYRTRKDATNALNAFKAGL